MPCNSDYLNPTHRERELRRAAKLMVYTTDKLGQVVPQWLQDVADDIYAKTDVVPELCEQLKGLTPEELEGVVYDAHAPEARDLADWWEEHLAADSKRERSEAHAIEQKTLRAKAIQKLSPEEQESLGIKP